MVFSSKVSGIYLTLNISRGSIDTIGAREDLKDKLDKRKKKHGVNKKEKNTSGMKGEMQKKEIWKAREGARQRKREVTENCPMVCQTTDSLCGAGNGGQGELKYKSSSK